MLKVIGASWFQTVISFLIVVGILLFGILINIICRTQNHEDDEKYAATVIWNSETEQYEIKLLGQNNDPNSIDRGIARAYYQPKMQETGWAILEIETNGKYSDEHQAYAAGILEGSLTWQHIYWQWKNTVKHFCNDENEFCAEVTSFLEKNSAVIKKKAKANDRSDPFWHQVNLFYVQLEGIEFGWNYEVRRNKQSYEIPSLDFLWLNIVSDLRDFQKLAFMFNNSYIHSPAAVTLLKLIPKDEPTFLLAQASSGFYSSMLRVQKKYSFNYHFTGRFSSELVPGRIISFTSYPGAIHSQDDFYQIQVNDGSKVTVTGTALSTVDSKDEQKMKDYQVLLGPRVMAGNRLSKNGKTWAYYVGRHNSGTGNKQWFHIQTTSDNITLWVMEQTHQKIKSKDETELLFQQGYLISCGMLYYKHNDDMKIDSAELVHYHAGNIPLKNILQVLHEGQQNVSDIYSLIDLMRGPELALAGRTDLHESITSKPAFGIVHEAKQDDFKNKQMLQNSHQGFKSSSPFLTKKYEKISNFDANIKHNFSIIYNSTWLNLFNLKNDILIKSTLKEKRKPSSNTINLRHNRILQQFNYDSKTYPKNKIEKIHRSANSVPNPTYNNRFLLTINGVIDLKVTDTNDRFLAAAGPPYNLQNKLKTIEPFQWSKSAINYLPHDGQADVWKYEPVEANFVWE